MVEMILKQQQRQEPWLKKCVLTASGQLNKATLLITLLEQVQGHIESLLETVIDRTKKIVRRLDLNGAENEELFTESLNV